MTGYLFNNAMEAKELGYKTYIVEDAAVINSGDYTSMMGYGINLINSATLLQKKYKCPSNDWLQCPLSGNCITKQRQCDGFMDCKDGFDEDPVEAVSDCCDEITVSGMDVESALLHQKYMGIYQKIECSR